MATHTLKTALTGRWKPEYAKHGISVAVRKHFDSVLNLVDTLDAKRAAIEADRNLSDIGRAQKMREVAIAEAPVLVKAQRGMETAQGLVRKQRLALTPTVKDKTDLAAAMLRQEVRSLLRSKEPGEALKIAMAPDADPIVAEAIFEAPTTLSNISQVHRDQLLSVIVERTAGPQLAALAEQDETIALLNAAIKGASEPLRQTADVAPIAFDKWLAETVPADPKDVAAEADALKAAAVSVDANGLPFNERKSLIDQLLETNRAEIGKAA